MNEARLRAYRPPKVRQPQQLTPQESRILELMLTDGVCNRELAEAFCISEETVKRHLSTIMDKTGYSTRLELVVRTLQERNKVNTGCYCGSVKRRYPGAFETKVPASEVRPPDYRIYDQDPPTRCLGRSEKGFTTAWKIAAAVVATEPEVL